MLCFLAVKCVLFPSPKKLRSDVKESEVQDKDDAHDRYGVDYGMIVSWCVETL